ncbi:unnamed protein product [Brugia pahangi]|uniref:Inorganic diphosphatase n=1 Tax=Brugia pahangi TaxID=6280 RepID=A0A0N4TM32_BRUPA|nr:unnamed protein product [Brugia pahangi]
MKDYGSYFQSYPHFKKVIELKDANNCFEKDDDDELQEVDIVVGIPHKYPMSQEAKDTDRFVKLQ